MAVRPIVAYEKRRRFVLALAPAAILMVGGLGSPIGCRGQQSLEGAWLGEFPYEAARDCRIRMTFEQKFDLMCRDPRRGATDPLWAGLGRYRPEGDTLEFTFEKLAKRGEEVRRVDPLRVKFVGKGNQLDVIDGDRVYVWRRAAP